MGKIYEPSRVVSETVTEEDDNSLFLALVEQLRAHKAARRSYVLYSYLTTLVYALEFLTVSAASLKDFSQLLYEIVNEFREKSFHPMIGRAFKELISYYAKVLAEEHLSTAADCYGLTLDNRPTYESEKAYVIRKITDIFSGLDRYKSDPTLHVSESPAVPLKLAYETLKSDCAMAITAEPTEKVVALGEGELSDEVVHTLKHKNLKVLGSLFDIAYRYVYQTVKNDNGYIETLPPALQALADNVLALVSELEQVEFTKPMPNMGLFSHYWLALQSYFLRCLNAYTYNILHYPVLWRDSAIDFDEYWPGEGTASFSETILCISRMACELRKGSSAQQKRANLVFLLDYFPYIESAHAAATPFREVNQYGHEFYPFMAALQRTRTPFDEVRAGRLDFFEAQRTASHESIVLLEAFFEACNALLGRKNISGDFIGKGSTWQDNRSSLSDIECAYAYIPTEGSFEDNRSYHLTVMRLLDLAILGLGEDGERWGGFRIDVSSHPLLPTGSEGMTEDGLKMGYGEYFSELSVLIKTLKAKYGNDIVAALCDGGGFRPICFAGGINQHANIIQKWMEEHINPYLAQTFSYKVLTRVFKDYFQQEPSAPLPENPLVTYRELIASCMLNDVLLKADETISHSALYLDDAPPMLSIKLALFQPATFVALMLRLYHQIDARSAPDIFAQACQRGLLWDGMQNLLLEIIRFIGTWREEQYAELWEKEKRPIQCDEVILYPIDKSVGGAEYDLSKSVATDLQRELLLLLHQGYIAPMAMVYRTAIIDYCIANDPAAVIAIPSREVLVQFVTVLRERLAGLAADFDNHHELVQTLIQHPLVQCLSQYPLPDGSNLAANWAQETFNHALQVRLSESEATTKSTLMINPHVRTEGMQFNLPEHWDEVCLRAINAKESKVTRGASLLLDSDYCVTFYPGRIDAAIKAFSGALWLRLVGNTLAYPINFGLLTLNQGRKTRALNTIINESQPVVAWPATHEADLACRSQLTPDSYAALVLLLALIDVDEFVFSLDLVCEGDEQYRLQFQLGHFIDDDVRCEADPKARVLQLLRWLTPQQALPKSMVEKLLLLEPSKVLASFQAEFGENAPSVESMSPSAFDPVLAAKKLSALQTLLISLGANEGAAVYLQDIVSDRCPELANESFGNRLQDFMQDHDFPALRSGVDVLVKQNKHPRQTFYLQLLSNGSPSTITRLNLANTPALTDSMLRAILRRCPQLAWINVSGCPQLTLKTLATLSYLDELTTLIWDDGACLTKFTFSKPMGNDFFPQLKALSLRHSPNLIEIDKFFLKPSLQRLCLAGSDKVKLKNPLRFYQYWCKQMNNALGANHIENAKHALDEVRAFAARTHGNEMVVKATIDSFEKQLAALIVNDRDLSQMYKQARLSPSSIQDSLQQVAPARTKVEVLPFIRCEGAEHSHRCDWDEVLQACELGELIAGETLWLVVQQARPMQHVTLIIKKPWEDCEPHLYAVLDPVEGEIHHAAIYRAFYGDDLSPNPMGIAPPTTLPTTLNAFYQSNDQHVACNTFRGWYPPEVFHTLLPVGPNPLGLLRVVFEDDPDNKESFIRQLRVLSQLTLALEKPGLFIAKQPGVTDHYIVGIILDKQLLLMDPLGDRYLNEQGKGNLVLQAALARQVVDNITFSSTPLQRRAFDGEQGLVSCGPIALALAYQLAATLTSVRFDELWEAMVSADQGIVDVYPFLGVGLQLLADCDTQERYVERVMALRHQHQDQLEYLSASPSTDNPLQSTFRTLAIEGRDLTPLDNFDAIVSMMPYSHSVPSAIHAGINRVPVEGCLHWLFLGLKSYAYRGVFKVNNNSLLYLSDDTLSERVRHGDYKGLVEQLADRALEQPSAVVTRANMNSLDFFFSQAVSLPLPPFFYRQAKPAGELLEDDIIGAWLNKQAEIIVGKFHPIPERQRTQSTRIKQGSERIAIEEKLYEEYQRYRSYLNKAVQHALPQLEASFKRLAQKYAIAKNVPTREAMRQRASGIIDDILAKYSIPRSQTGSDSNETLHVALVERQQRYQQQCAVNRTLRSPTAGNTVLEVLARVWSDERRALLLSCLITSEAYPFFKTWTHLEAGRRGMLLKQSLSGNEDYAAGYPLAIKALECGHVGLYATLKVTSPITWDVLTHLCENQQWQWLGNLFDNEQDIDESLTWLWQLHENAWHERQELRYSQRVYQALLDTVRQRTTFRKMAKGDSYARPGIAREALDRSFRQIRQVLLGELKQFFNTEDTYYWRGRLIYRELSEHCLHNHWEQAHYERSLYVNSLLTTFKENAYLFFEGVERKLEKRLEGIQNKLVHYEYLDNAFEAPRRKLHTSRLMRREKILLNAQEQVAYTWPLPWNLNLPAQEKAALLASMRLPTSLLNARGQSLLDVVSEIAGPTLSELIAQLVAQRHWSALAIMLQSQLCSGVLSSNIGFFMVPSSHDGYSFLHYLFESGKRNLLYRLLGTFDGLTLLVKSAGEGNTFFSIHDPEGETFMHRLLQDAAQFVGLKTHPIYQLNLIEQLLGADVPLAAKNVQEVSAWDWLDRAAEGRAPLICVADVEAFQQQCRQWRLLAAQRVMDPKQLSLSVHHCSPLPVLANQLTALMDVTSTNETGLILVNNLSRTPFNMLRKILTHISRQEQWQLVRATQALLEGFYVGVVSGLIDSNFERFQQMIDSFEGVVTLLATDDHAGEQYNGETARAQCRAALDYLENFGGKVKNDGSEEPKASGDNGPGNSGAQDKTPEDESIPEPAVPSSSLRELQANFDVERVAKEAAEQRAAQERRLRLAQAKELEKLKREMRAGLVEPGKAPSDDGAAFDDGAASDDEQAAQDEQHERDRNSVEALGAGGGVFHGTEGAPGGASKAGDSVAVELEGAEADELSQNEKKREVKGCT